METKKLNHRNAEATLIRAEMLNDYLRRKGSEENERYNNLVRIQAREVASITKIPGCCDELCDLIGKYTGALISALVEIREPQKRAEFINTINAAAANDEKAMFSIYQMRISDILEESGKSGFSAISRKNGVKFTRYVTLEQVYCGADKNRERENDAMKALHNRFTKLIMQGFKESD